MPMLQGQKVKVIGSFCAKTCFSSDLEVHGRCGWPLGVKVSNTQVGDDVHSTDDGQEPTRSAGDQQTEEDESPAWAAG